MTQTQLSDLKPGDALKGKVAGIELAGAFVDIGLEVNGFVHISNLAERKVNRVDELLELGQEVDVWVANVDPQAGRLELTMVKPVELQWDQIKPGMLLTGKVVRIEGFGAFVDIGAERHGLVHVSEMSSEYVRDPKEVVSVGNQVEVSVLEVDRKKRQIRLSMKAASITPEFEDEEPEEELPTAMEVALRKAMEGSDKKPKRAAKADEQPETEQREELDDLLSRTLSQRVKNTTQNTDEKE